MACPPILLPDLPDNLYLTIILIIGKQVDAILNNLIIIKTYITIIVINRSVLIKFQEGNSIYFIGSIVFILLLKI
jgi:hypothetical protein